MTTGKSFSNEEKREKLDFSPFSKFLALQDSSIGDIVSH